LSAYPYRLILTKDTIIFCSCDIVSLVVQAVGGATASTAVSNNDDPADVSSLFGFGRPNTYLSF